MTSAETHPPSKPSDAEDGGHDRLHDQDDPLALGCARAERTLRAKTQ